MESESVSAKPLTKEETKILVTFIEASKIITNKATNATSNKLKTEEWKRIADQFNAVVTSCYRTPQQLRLIWENLKKNSRKRNTLIRMNNIKTGGGGPDYIPPDDVLDRLAALLGNTVDGFTVIYGGDAEVELDQEERTCANVSGGDFMKTDLAHSEMLSDEVKSLSPGVQVLNEIIINDAEDSGECSVKKPKKLYTPRASGNKRKLYTKNDENRSTRNEAVANYLQ